MPRHLLALALGVCAGVAVMVVAARGIALSRMLYLLAGLIFAGNLFAALAFDYWSMLAARFIAGLPHGAYFGVGAIVATSLAAPGQASRDVCLMVTGMTIANLVGVPLGSFLAWSLSWRATFAVVACAALLLILALRLWMPHVPALPNKGFRAQFRFLGHLTPWLVLGAVAWGMMRVLIKEGLVNKPFIDKWCIGYDELVAYAEKFTPEYVEKESGVPAELVVKAARMFADGPSGITISGQSIMHQHNGCNNARACSLLMALTGNVENAGGGMLPNWPEDYLRWDEGYTRSFIDQKWFNEPEQKAKRIDREFVPVWNEMQVLCSPNMLPEMVRDGRIRAIAGFGMNALIWPSPEQYQEAIRKVDFSFAADNFYRDETHHDMDIVLPAALNFERYAPFGVHGRKVSVRRPVKPQGEAWEDWKIACTIGAAVCDPETFFHGDPVKACDSILKDWGVTYEKQQGVLPNLQTVEFFPPQTTGKHEKALLRFDGKPGFRTPSGKIELVASLQAKHGFPGLPVYVEPPKPTVEYPFKLLNGTRRPYITHSKTRSDQPYLLELEPESTINMHPKDAEKLGIKEGDGVWLVSPYCDHKVRAKVRVTILCQPGLIDAQYGWRGDQETQPLIPRKNWDPISGYPCCNDVCIRVEKA
jgi:putative molybdopterin oxidoreductase, molybdopterin binding subunit